MVRSRLKLFILIFILLLPLPAFAQNTPPALGSGPDLAKNTNPGINLTPLTSASDDMIPSEKNSSPYIFFLNKKTPKVNKDKKAKLSKEERDIWRDEWAKALGIDIFYPYFKAKEVEEMLTEKASIHLYKMKGRPKLSDDYFQYIFKVSF